MPPVATLPGRSRTIVVEPLERPDPEPVPVPAREPEPAAPPPEPAPAEPARS